MVTFGKGITAAIAPLSGVATSQKIFDHFADKPLGIGNTYFAHPISVAAAYGVVKHLLEHDILGQVREKEVIMKREMEKLVANHKSAKNGRVIGMGAGIDLGDKHGNFLFGMEGTSPGLALLKKTHMEKGLIALYRGHFFQFSPPYTITEEEICEGFDIIDKSLYVLDDWIEKQDTPKPEYFEIPS